MEDKEQAKGNEAKRFGAGVNKRWVLTVVMLVVMAWGAWYFTRMATGFDGDEAVWVRIPRLLSILQKILLRQLLAIISEAGWQRYGTAI